MENATEWDVQNALKGLLQDGYDSEEVFADAHVRTFDEAGMMTYNRGVVITLPDGSEFQLTIVQSK